MKYFPVLAFGVLFASMEFQPRSVDYSNCFLDIQIAGGHF